MIRHGRIGITRPEMFPKPFRIYEQESTINNSGREKLGSYVIKGTANCILSVAKHQERAMFEQIGVVVTHTIIQRGLPVAKEQDVFVLLKHGAETRRFRVQSVHDKGSMGIDTVYYCEERGDIRWQA